MNNTDLRLSMNDIERHCNKRQCEFTREDIVRYITDNGIHMVNFMYAAADGRLKTLNFVINDLAYLETILTLGERVDGSSLFPYINAASSDLYVLPRYSTAFVDPFADEPTVTMLCRYCDKDGHALESAPENILRKACDEFTRSTGMTFEAMGELEYYVISPVTDERYPATDQKGYHESAPFAKHNEFRTACMRLIAGTGGAIKYGHSEVGTFVDGDRLYEQNEIEFLPIYAPNAADQLMIAKWIIRNEGARRGLEVTFAPKITTGKAGSGLHIHFRMTKDGKNMMLDEQRRISSVARRGIAGLMQLAPAITAFGNTNPTSYFRLVPHQEAPTNVCWGDRNRSVLVRVPLGWTADSDMCAIANPGQSGLAEIDATMKQTVELRSGDGTADVYLLMAGIVTALRHGLEMNPDEAEGIASKTYVDVNIHDASNASRLEALDSLPVDCASSAACLEENRRYFEDKGVFPTATIDGQMAKLRSYDADEARRALGNPDLMLSMVKRYLHC